MDPCPYVRIVIGSLGLKFTGAGDGAPPSTTAYCKIKLKNQPTQFTEISSVVDGDANQADDQVNACFNLKKSEFDKSNMLKIEVYSGRKSGNPVCGFGFGSGRLLGVVTVGLDSEAVEGGGNKGCVVVRNGWVGIGDRCYKNMVNLHLRIRVERDPRFVFEFDGEPECSPQVFQVNGNVRQAVFTSKFSFRNNRDQNLRSDSSLSESSNSKSWLRSIQKDKEKPVKERKGWSITIHDLSGSPVAMASMVTPFVPSHGTDSVSSSNPGAWLILRPGNSTWKPWGRLEAWRESKHNKDSLGYRFELLPDAAVNGLDPVTLASSTLSFKTGGKFTIDMSNGASPMSTPNGSFGSGSGSSSDFEFGSWAHLMYQGFVMSSSVGGEGKAEVEVEVGIQHVTCTEDAAAFVALAAAMDLCVDACQPFSRKLRPELRNGAE